MIEYVMTCDSPKFCEAIIGQSTFMQEDMVEPTSNRKALKTNSFKNVISTVMKACVAAFYGDLQVLIKLKEQGLNLNNGDYYSRGPLYYAIRGN